MRFSRIQFSLAINILLLLAIALSGCASKPPAPEPMMPTPVLYSAGAIDPFAHLPDDQLTTDLRVFYATNRVPEGPSTDPQYGNDIGTVLHLGEAVVRFGDETMTWAELVSASMQAPPNVASKASYREPEVPLYLIETHELAAFDTSPASGAPGVLSAGEQQFAAAINRQLEGVLDKQLIVYVHGAKQNFYKSMVFTAEVNHFMGRDLVGVGYAWPTHQGIIEYGIGIDVKRARNSVEPLIELIEFLAANTDADKINIICWSAGARVLSAALATLRERNSQLDEQALQEKFRLGSVIFAAADVPRDHFSERLRGIHAISARLTIFMSDDDSVLKFGQEMMPGGQRTGQLSKDIDPDQEKTEVAGLDKLEVIDVSHFQEERGFDITGHRYWYTHSWSNTDVLMNIRTGLAPEERGLQSTGLEQIWGFPPDYPERVSTAIRQHLQAQTGSGKKQWQ